MSIFGNKPRTAQQKAQSAKMRLMIRLVACLYLVFYIIIPMLRDAPDDDSMPLVWRVIIITFFIISVGVVAGISLKEYLIKRKTGGFKPEAYEDDPGIVKPEEEHDTDDDPDDDDYDYEDDDDYDEYDDEDDYDEDDYEDDDEDDEEER